MQAVKVGHLRLNVCVWEWSTCLCARMCVAAALGHLHASALSGCQELWGHRQGRGEGTLQEASEHPPSHPPHLHDPSPCTSHNPNRYFSFFRVIPHHPSSYPSSSSGDGMSRPLGGEGVQEGKVPLWLTAGRSGFCRHGREGRTHARRHIKVCECVRERKKECIYLRACMDICAVYVNTWNEAFAIRWW